MTNFEKKKSISVEGMGWTLAEFTWLSFKDCLELKRFPEAKKIISPMEIASESRYHIELLIFHVFIVIRTCKGNIMPNTKFESLVCAYRGSIYKKVAGEYPESVFRRFKTILDTREYEYSKILTSKEGTNSLLILGQTVMSKMLGRNVEDMRLIKLVLTWYAIFRGVVKEFLEIFKIEDK
jgi:hypothetical protein